MSISDRIEITYRQVGDVLLPNLTLRPQPEGDIGKYGSMHREFIREHRKILYNTLMFNGELFQHLIDTNIQAHDMIDTLVKQMATKEGVTEALKASDQMEWVQRMNNIKARAEEIVFKELIYV